MMPTTNLSHRRADVPTSGADSPDRELGLSDYLLILWRRGVLIAGVTLVCGIAAFLVSSRMARVYEASVILSVSPSKMSEGPDTPIALSSFRALMENRAIARTVIDELELGRAPYSLTPAGFVDRNLTIDEIRNTNYLRIRVRLADPSLAAQAANRLVDRAVELNTRLKQREDLAVRDFERRELDETSSRMRELGESLLDFKRDAQVELTREDIRSLLDQRGRVPQLIVDIEGERARLATAEEELAKQPPTLRAARSRDLETTLAAVTRPSRSGREQESDGLVGVEFDGGTANPVHELLQYQVASSRARLSSLERQRDELKGLNVSGHAIGKFRELHQKEAELARRTTEYDLATKIYSEARSRYEQARIRVASKSAQLTVVDPAVPPDAPVSPRPLLNAAVAMALGFIFVSAGVVGYALLL